jgi:hypothetical protein
MSGSTVVSDLASLRSVKRSALSMLFQECWARWKRGYGSLPIASVHRVISSGVI